MHRSVLYRHRFQNAMLLSSRIEAFGLTRRVRGWLHQSPNPGASYRHAAAATPKDGQQGPSASTAPHIRAAVFTGAYAVIFGLALTIAPGPVFGLLFNAETVPTSWIRVGGILFTLIGWQYLGTAAADRQGQGALGFYRATVWSRLALAAAFTLLVVSRQSPPGLLVLAAMNLLGAIGMHLALRRTAPVTIGGEEARGEGVRIVGSGSNTHASSGGQG